MGDVGVVAPFLFQIALSLLFLNQQQIMQLRSAAQVYTFINHNMTDHGVSLDSLIRAAEALGGEDQEGGGAGEAREGEEGSGWVTSVLEDR